ncbi:MAG: FtsX-like permease family protein, partial [Balneolaceae bacterium]|nr:FtsX-like permease family protein [Balneolaceae bacterium]
TITNFSDEPIYRSDTLVTYLGQFPEIDEVQPVVTGQAMLQTQDEVTGTLFKGVSASGDVTDIREYINRGAYDLATDSSGLPGLVAGADLAKTLNAQVGSLLTSYTVEGFPSLLSSPEIQQFRLTGIYQTGIGRFDDLFVLVDRRYAGKLFQLPGIHASAVEIRLKDNSRIREFDQQLSDALPFPYFTESIYERYGNIFAWVDLQEQTIPFVISVMIIVAAFNLIGTVLMMVLERTSDIGILKTIGAKSDEVRKVFLLEGVFVAAIGLAIGIGLSLLFAWIQSTYQLIPLSEQNYYMSYAPVEPHAIDFLLVSGVTILLCGLASWLPARIAARTDPLKVIAYGR